MFSECASNWLLKQQHQQTGIRDRVLYCDKKAKWIEDVLWCTHAVVKNFRQLCQLCGSMRAKAKNIIKTSNLLLHVEVSQNQQGCHFENWKLKRFAPDLADRRSRTWCLVHGESEMKDHIWRSRGKFIAELRTNVYWNPLLSFLSLLLKPYHSPRHQIYKSFQNN